MAPLREAGGRETFVTLTHGSEDPNGAADEADIGPAVSRGSGLSPEQRRYLEARADAKRRTVLPIIVTLMACGPIIGRPPPSTLRIAVAGAVLTAGLATSALLYLRWKRAG